jgi:hypothetical protein
MTRTQAVTPPDPRNVASGQLGAVSDAFPGTGELDDPIRTYDRRERPFTDDREIPPSTEI